MTAFQARRLMIGTDDCKRMLGHLSSCHQLDCQQLPPLASSTRTTNHQFNVRNVQLTVVPKEAM
jgi:hypothetical protein